MPVAAVSVGLIAVYLILRSMTRRGNAPVIAQPVTDAGLIPYLQLVDRHLDMTRSASQTGSTSNPNSSGVESPGEPPEDSTATDESEANVDQGEQSK